MENGSLDPSHYLNFFKICTSLNNFLRFQLLFCIYCLQVLICGTTPCPLFVKEKAAVVNSSIQKMMDEHRQLIDHLSKMTGVEMKSVMDIELLYDNLLIAVRFLIFISLLISFFRFLSNSLNGREKKNLMCGPFTAQGNTSGATILKFK